jgi:hypothetical protein
MRTQRKRGGRVLERGHARGAHPLVAAGEHRRRGELALHHISEARQRQIAARAARAEHAHLLERHSAAAQTVLHRQRRHAASGVQRPPLLIDRVVPGLDAVLFEHAALHALCTRVERHDEAIERVVVDWRAGQEAACRRQIDRVERERHEVPTDP